MAREIGFYWVRTLDDANGGWIIAEWIDGPSAEGRDHRWRLPGRFLHVRDHDFQEIDERRLERVKRRTWRHDRTPAARA